MTKYTVSDEVQRELSDELLKAMMAVETAEAAKPKGTTHNYWAGRRDALLEVIYMTCGINAQRVISDAQVLFNRNVQARRRPRTRTVVDR
jgi:hypothetical protein